MMEMLQINYFSIIFHFEKSLTEKLNVSVWLNWLNYCVTTFAHKVSPPSRSMHPHTMNDWVVFFRVSDRYSGTPYCVTMCECSVDTQKVCKPLC